METDIKITLYRRISIILAMSLWCFQVYAKESISWQTYHSPPISIKRGEDAGQGFLDKIMVLLAQRLPEYEHRYPLTPLSQTLSDMRQGKSVCHPGLMVTPERQTYAHFSKPSLITPNLRLISNVQNPLLTQITQPVSVQDLVTQEDIVFGLIKGRSYGTDLDLRLREVPHQRVLLLSVKESHVILKLVAMDRLDVTVAFPYEVGYFNNKTTTKNTLRSFTIAGKESYALGSVACTKNEWGRQVIERIDKILETLRHEPEYLDAMTYWWQQEREKEAFKVALKETFGTP